MAIGDPIDDRAAEAGDHAQQGAETRAAHCQPAIGPGVLDALKPARAEIGPGAGFGDRGVLAQEIADFGNGEHGEADDDEFNAVHQIERAEIHAVFAGGRSCPHRAEREACRTGRDALGQALA